MKKLTSPSISTLPRTTFFQWVLYKNVLHLKIIDAATDPLSGLLCDFPLLTHVYYHHILSSMDTFALLQKCTGFEWDAHNADKIRQKHQVTPSECEEIFFNRPLVVDDDVRHSGQETRFYALGHTNAGRTLFAVFTIRHNLIRVISARDMNRKERKVYQAHE